MRASSSLLACLALAAQLLLGPWQHVHAHGHSAHHAQSGWHVHQASQPGGSAWKPHGPDEDARSFWSLPGTLQDTRHASPALLTAVLEAAPPTLAGNALQTCVPCGHDPPGRPSRSPRAPPTPAPSLV